MLFLKVPLFLLRVHFNVYINMYHLGRSSAGTPIALTQGMEDNILQPPSRKLVSSFFHMNLIGGGGL